MAKKVGKQSRITKRSGFSNFSIGDYPIGVAIAAKIKAVAVCAKFPNRAFVILA